jgi:hypothetical protein
MCAHHRAIYLSDNFFTPTLVPAVPVYPRGNTHHQFNKKLLIQ